MDISRPTASSAADAAASPLTTHDWPPLAAVTRPRPRSESAPGGTAGGGPRMVPTDETFSTPLQPDALAHGTHGHAASACDGGWGYFASRVPGVSTQHVDADGTTGYPTPGVAYEAYDVPLGAHLQAHAAPSADMVPFNVQLEAAMREVERISMVAGVPSPLVRSPLMLPTVRLDELPPVGGPLPPPH